MHSHSLYTHTHIHTPHTLTIHTQHTQGLGGNETLEFNIFIMCLQKSVLEILIVLLGCFDLLE